MAVTTGSEEKKKALGLAIAQIEKSCGKGSIMRMGAKEKVRIEAVPTGAINLDAAIGVGGIPRGRVTEIYGPESSGKTTLCLHVVANAQKMGGVAAFIDAEHALDTEYARKLGVDVEALLIAARYRRTGARDLRDSRALRCGGHRGHRFRGCAGSEGGN